jgi:hypothetical protein
MITCQVYKKVELLKFLEVEGINLTLEEGMYSDHKPDFDINGREFTASIRVFGLDDYLDEDDGVKERMIYGLGFTPEKAIQNLSAMLEGDCRTLYKKAHNLVTGEYEKGELLIIPPLVHTECEIINDVAEYQVFNPKTSEHTPFDYSKYE